MLNALTNMDGSVLVRWNCGEGDMVRCMENSPSFTTLHAVVTCNYGNFPRQLSKYIIILWAAQLGLSLIGIGQRKKEFT